MIDTVKIPLTAGRSEQVPHSIVVHALAEFIDGVPAVDFLRSIGLSAHALVTPSGVVIRCRDDDQGAYHARGGNTNTLGIEYLVSGNHDYGSFKDTIKAPYLTDKQYESGLWQLREWRKNWIIGDISRHSDIDPDRKVDPGTGFPWDNVLRALQ